MTTHATATPFEKAGYTKDTKFRVIHEDPCHGIETGDIVWLSEDDDTTLPEFTNGKSFRYFSFLPEDCELEVLPNIGDTCKGATSTVESSPAVTITHNLTIKGYTHILTTDEMVEVFEGLRAIMLLPEEQNND